MSEPAGARRPLKSRGTSWARFFSTGMLRIGLKPNTVSLLSILCAGLGGAAIWLASREGGSPWWWLAAIAGVQLRLFCNLMDGMLAVEGGLKSPVGELYNEIPDRVADALILVPLGYAGGTGLCIALGWAAAWGAAVTAYLRTMGAALLGRHDFCGPMAKPHRMAAVTLCCLAMLIPGVAQHKAPVMLGSIIFLNAGIIITIWRRVHHLAKGLHQKDPSP